MTLNVPSQGPPLQPGAVGVRPTGNPSLGNGAYAALPIPEGTHIADYSGDLLGRREFFERCECLQLLGSWTSALFCPARMSQAQPYALSGALCPRSPCRGVLLLNNRTCCIQPSRPA